MGEPYTVTALIVITLGGFGSMSGALAGGLLLGVIEALGMHFTNPSLKACCRTACSSRYCCCARKGFSPNEQPTRARSRSAGPVRPDWLGLALPHYGSEFVVSMALTCLMYVALSSSWALFCGSSRYLSLATSAFFGIGAYTSALVLEPLGWGAAIALGAGLATVVAVVMGAAVLHLRGTYFRGADLRHDRADPPCHQLFRKAGNRHRGPRADGGARARHHLPHGAGPGGAGGGRFHRRAAQPLWPGAAGHRRGRAARADAGREHTAGEDRRLCHDGGVCRRGGRGHVVRWTYIDPHTVFNPFIGFQTVLIALIGGATTLWGPLIAAIVFSLLAETLRLQVPQLYMMSAGLAADPVGAVPAGRPGLAALDHVWRLGPRSAQTLASAAGTGGRTPWLRRFPSCSTPAMSPCASVG
jgi:branched-chain amino acid transport system permease protein